MRRAPQSGTQALTPIEFHILLSLADGERHGYAILQDVSDRTGEKLRTGTLYTVIKRLLDSAWIEDGDAPGDGDDERRRYYRLTDAGRETLKTEARRLQDLVALAQEKRVLARPRKLATARGR